MHEVTLLVAATFPNPKIHFHAVLSFTTVPLNNLAMLCFAPINNVHVLKACHMFCLDPLYICIILNANCIHLNTVRSNNSYSLHPIHHCLPSLSTYALIKHIHGIFFGKHSHVALGSIVLNILAANVATSWTHAFRNPPGWSSVGMQLHLVLTWIVYQALFTVSAVVVLYSE